MNRLNNLAERNRQWREETQRHGDCSFIPAVSPGYNDRGVRYEKNHPALSRKLCGNEWHEDTPQIEPQYLLVKQINQ